MNPVSVILLAGGRGTRMGTAIPKQFLPLSDRAIVLHSLEIFLNYSEVEEIVVVCDPVYRSYFSDFFVRFAPPGERRQDSVYHGLQAVSEKIEWICVHDAARPFISSEMLTALFREGRKVGAATVGMPIKWTLKETHKDCYVKRTLERRDMWEIQTPQFLSKRVLKRGFQHAQAHNLTVTDDVSLAENINHPVKVVEGSDRNIKITTPEDLAFARCLSTVCL